VKTFQITLRAPRDADDATAVRALRSILKLAWRRFRLRAVDVRVLDAREDVAKSGTCSAFASTPDVSDDPRRP
jgi:hypothetical protein